MKFEKGELIEWSWTYASLKEYGPCEGIYLENLGNGYHKVEEHDGIEHYVEFVKHAKYDSTFKVGGISCLLIETSDSLNKIMDKK